MAGQAARQNHDQSSSGDNAPEPRLILVKTSQMIVDRDYYQRPLRGAKVRQIKRDYKVSQGFPPLSAHLRADGSVAVLDGGHRLEAARGLGITALWCNLWEGQTVQWESAMYNMLNNSRTPNALDRFAALVTALSPAALKVEEILAPFNMYVTKPAQTLQGNPFGENGHGWLCPETLLHVVTSPGGPKRLNDMLTLIVTCWPEERLLWNSDLIKALLRFSAKHAKNQNFAYNRAVKKFSDVSLERLFKLADASIKGREPRWSAVVGALEYFYDRNVKNRNRLLPREVEEDEDETMGAVGAYDLV